MIFNPLNYPPYNHWQLSSDNLCDGEYCLSCMFVDCLTPLAKLYGDNLDYNPQYLAETARTTINGNTEYNVDVAFYQDGLVPTSVLPELTQFSWNALYGRDLSQIIPIGQRFWDRYDPLESTITQISPSSAVQMSKTATFTDPYTIGVIVDLNNGLGGPMYHGQALLNGSIWDSYPTNPKASNHLIKWAYKFVLKPKNMSNVKLIKHGTEFAYYVPATNEQALIDKANNFGYPLPTINNGGNVDWGQVKPDYEIPA
jgi:hypothetical protein